MSFEPPSPQVPAIDPIVLDRDGRPISGPEIHSDPQGVRSFQLSGSLGPWLGTAAAVTLLLAGVTFAGVLLAAFLGFWLLRSVLSLLGLVRPRTGRSRAAFFSVRRF
jgi:hypothetical protein